MNKPQEPLLKDRVAQLEIVARETDQELGKLGTALKGMLEVLSGVMAALGPETEAKVVQFVESKRDERARAEAESAEADHKRFVEAKVLQPAEVILADNCVVGGRELDSTGKVCHYGVKRTRVEQFRDEAKTFLVGKGVGAVFEAPNGSKFEVTEIWTINQSALNPTEIDNVKTQ
jgi:hypothetical protein